MRSESKTSLLLVALVALVAVPAFALNVIEDHQDIEGPFASGPEVTATCLECHDDVAEAFMHTSLRHVQPAQCAHILDRKLPLPRCER